MSTTRTGLPRQRGAGLLVLLAVLVTVALAASLTACSQQVSITPPKAPADSSAERAQRAQAALDAFAAAVSGGDATKAAAQGRGAVLADAYANARTLHLQGVGFRYVEDLPGAATAAEQSRYGAGSWVGTVELTYRIPGFDGSPTRMETAMVFTPHDGGVQVADVGGHGDRSPSWLRGPLTVVRGRRTLVLSADRTGAQQYAALAVRAVHDVGLVLPRWRGSLVVEVPASEGDLDSMLAADQAEYANIAAVTTTVDGTVVPGSAVHVFLNPAVFATLKPQGAQVVLSHEATHVATRATFADLPEWLLEGFADYVALDHAGVPVQVAAHQILGRVRRHGVPAALPTAADLEPTASGLGATYEEAWLANRSLALHFGEQRLVAFYQAVTDGEPVAAAFRRQVGTTQAAFVALWRADLRQLAAAR